MTEFGIWGRSWQSLNLDPAFFERMTRWQTVFDRNFTAESGWRDEVTRDDWAAEDADLIRQLRLTLPDIEVTADMWPLEHADEV